jgi:hypothetical protein
MVAARNFAPGEIIVQEAPLGHIGPTLNDPHNPNTFFDQNDIHNGVRLIESMIARMSNVQKRKFFDLHDSTMEVTKSRQKCAAGIMQTNAFDDDTDDTLGQGMLTLRIYNNISRANHSCRPILSTLISTA